MERGKWRTKMTTSPILSDNLKTWHGNRWKILALGRVRT